MRNDLAPGGDPLLSDSDRVAACGHRRERSHRIDAEEFYRLLDGAVIDDTGLLNDKLRE